MWPTNATNALKVNQKCLKLRIFIENVKEYCKITTMHGFKYIVDEQLYPFERYFFVAFIVIAWCFSGYFMHSMCQRWSRTPIIIGINPQPSYVVKEPFPAVTICNLNQVLKSKAMHLSRDSQEYAVVQLLCKRPVSSKLLENITDWSILEKIILENSQQCNDMLLQCRFGGQEYNCSHIFHSTVTDEGLCCTFNMLHPKYMYISHIPISWRNITKIKPQPINWYAECGYPDELPEFYMPFTAPGMGESLGLRLILNVQLDEYYCSSSNSYGFKIDLHSPNEASNVRETGLYFSAGNEIKLRIRPEKTISLDGLRSVDIKYRRCLFHNEGKLIHFRHYTQRNCELECLSKLYIQYCGCITYSMAKIIENSTICSYREFDCVQATMREIYRDSCLAECLPSCNDLMFYMHEFSTPLYAESINQTLLGLKNYSQTDLVNNLAYIDMYYKDHYFRSTIQTELKGFADYLANIGGLLSVFLGFSCTFIIELFVYLCLRNIIKLCPFKNKAPIIVQPVLSKRKPINRRFYERQRQRQHYSQNMYKRRLQPFNYGAYQE